MIQDAMQTTLAIARVAVSWAYLAVNYDGDVDIVYMYICIYKMIVQQLRGNDLQSYLTMHNIISRERIERSR